jgi:formate hydrogenlyase transcriptional activator
MGATPNTAAGKRFDAVEDPAQQAEDRLRLVVDTTPALIHTGRPDGYLDYFNKRWLEYLGLPLEDVCGWGWTNSVHPEDVEAMLEKWRAALASGEPFEAEARVRRADGEYRRLLHRKVPLRDSHGNIVKWYGSSLDIEDRVQMTQELRRREAYLAEAQRLSHTGSFGWRISTGKILWSEETFRIFQYDQTTKPTVELILERVHPEDAALVKRTIDGALQDRRDFDFEHRLLMPDGSIKYVHVVVHALNGESGRVEFVGAVMDITTAKRAFDEIRNLRDQLYRENLALRQEIDQASMFEEIIGSSEALRRVLVHVAKVAPTDSTVLITGETGTGKELVARAIHRRSQRSTRAFVHLNCAAIPPSLVASELFGHEKGAFTGAVQRRLGRFELADGGTLFLDEIGELPAETQIALLRVLQEREFERVGGSQPIPADVRVLAATNRDLHAAVNAGTFRQDLFYRLNVFPIRLPSLRERAEDIPLLVEYLTERYASRAGKKIRSVKRQTLELLQAYDWPGNIRELQNVVERAVILCEDDTLSVDESWLQRECPPPSVNRANEATKGLVRLDADREKEIVESALAESRGRISGPAGAAAKLGIPRSTLESRIQSLGINKHRFKAA